MADKEKRIQAWTQIGELFESRDSKTLSGEIRVACPLQLQNGCDLVIREIPKSERRDNGPTFRAALVRDLGPVPEKGSSR